MLLFLICICLSAVLRFRTYLLTRRIQVVLAGLAQVRVDQTTESQLLKAVPDLVQYGGDRQRRASTERHYTVTISNDEEGYGMLGMHWVPEFLFSFGTEHDWNGPIHSKWRAMSLPFKVAYVLGWRHLTFEAWASVSDGVVSVTGYRIEPDFFLGWPASDLVVAHSVHGFWARHAIPVPVASIDDESPDFRFGGISGRFSSFAGDDAGIGVAYTASAPPELVSHVFRFDLSCFWGIRGCDSVRQVVPFLWADRRAIRIRTAARLASENPCPDQILAGRVRTLPDLNVALLDVVSSRSAGTDYRLREVIRGGPEGPLIEMGEIENPMPPPHPNLGDRFLYFSGAHFDSCRIVPATPSAEAAVRKTAPAPRRKEDEVSFGGRL